MLFPNTKEEDRTGSTEWLRWGKDSEVGTGRWVGGPAQRMGGPVTPHMRGQGALLPLLAGLSSK